MFRSAAVKLSLYYLALIMGLSLGFSFFLYHVSDAAIDHSLDRPRFITFDQVPTNDYNNFHQNRLAAAEANLQDDLILFNIIILVGGGIVSYALARRTLEPIEAAMEGQSRFTADASHELRTPLTTMQTEIEVALRNKQLNKDQAVELLGSNLEEVIKLRTLADSLLKLARSDQTTIELKKLDLAAVVKQTIKRHQILAKAKNITLVAKIAEVNALGDKDSLAEVIAILIDNAIKYSPKDTTVTVTGSSNNGQVVLDVADQGPGINASDLPFIFERFYRSDTSRTKKEADGYGLGLSIAKALTELQNGAISVVSQEDKGSTFSVHLPLS